MFLNNVFGIGSNRIDPTEERDPPPEATPVTFPVYRSDRSVTWSSDSPPPQLQPLFAKINKPADIRSQHLEALNVKIDTACSVADLLPASARGPTSHSPPSLDQSVKAASYADATKIDPNTAKQRREALEYENRLAELKVDNDTAYRVINRSPLPGTKPPRLAYMRKFWEGLESMSHYWDTSLDQYYDAFPAEEADSSSSPKRQRLDSANEPVASADGVDQHSQTPTGGDRNAMHSDSIHDNSSNAVKANDAMKQHLHSAPRLSRTMRSSSATPEPRLHQRYKGRRTGNGRQMPEQFRLDTVRAFVEATVWPFQTAVAPPRHMPVVQLGTLNLPVRQTAAVYRLPQDRARARQGFLQGPLMAVQVRGDTDFGGGGGGGGAIKSEAVAAAAARIDLLRELGGLLQLAQERAREGEAETKPGEGKWWTMTPRWGGGAGGGAHDGAEITNGDAVQLAEEMARGSGDRSGGNAARGWRRKTPMMLWKELKCGTGFWDPRTEYQAFGKDPTSPYDEIWMVSSLYHHVSILKLTIHTAYTEYLVTGSPPHPLPQDDGWCSPRLQRTAWFDLFDMDQRVEAFRALSEIMAYIHRTPQT